MTEDPAKCPKCSSPVTPGMKFCESCGTKIEALPACAKCGAALAPGIRFCENCGAPSAPASPEPEKPPVRAEEKPAPVPEKTLAKADEKPAPAPEKPVPVKEIPAPVKPKEAVPGQARSPATMILAGIVILAVLGAAGYFVVLPMLSGAGSPGAAAATPSSTQSAGSPGGSTPAASGTVSLVAGPTDSLPAERSLIIDVERDAISRDIIVTFQGGNGQYGVRELAITLTRSDGTVETRTMSHLERGDSVSLTGSDKENRVEVTANFFNGESYKVVDKVFEYKKRMGTY